MCDCPDWKLILNGLYLASLSIKKAFSSFVLQSRVCTRICNLAVAMVQISISESRKLGRLRHLYIKLGEDKIKENILVAFKFPFAFFLQEIEMSLAQNVLPVE